MSIYSSVSFAAQGCVIKVGWMERPSYQYADKRKRPQGFDIDYMRAVGKDLSCDIEFRRLPWIRQTKEMKAGSIDLLLGVFKTGKSSGTMALSDSYRNDPVGFYVHKSDVKLIGRKSISQLMEGNFRLGIIGHDTKSIEVARLLKKPRYQRKISKIKSAQALLRNLNRKLINGGMLHSAEVDYLHSINDPMVRDLKLIPHLSFTKPVHFITGRDAPRGFDFLKTINGSIKRLESKGITNQLLRKHVPSDFEILIQEK